MANICCWNQTSLLATLSLYAFFSLLWFRDEKKCWFYKMSILMRSIALVAVIIPQSPAQSWFNQLQSGCSTEPELGVEWRARIQHESGIKFTPGRIFGTVLALCLRLFIIQSSPLSGMDSRRLLIRKNQSLIIIAVEMVKCLDFVLSR